MKLFDLYGHCENQGKIPPFDYKPFGNSELVEINVLGQAFW
jgi:hypothetical protein